MIIYYSIIVFIKPLEYYISYFVLKWCVVIFCFSFTTSNTLRPMKLRARSSRACIFFSKTNLESPYELLLYRNTPNFRIILLPQNLLNGDKKNKRERLPKKSASRCITFHMHAYMHPAHICISSQSNADLRLKRVSETFFVASCAISSFQIHFTACVGFVLFGTKVVLSRLDDLLSSFWSRIAKITQVYHR